MEEVCIINYGLGNVQSLKMPYKIWSQTNCYS